MENQTDAVSVVSHKSARSRTSRSSRASSRSDHLILRRQEAAIKASSAFDEEEAKLELTLRNLRTQRKLACLQAEQAVLEESAESEFSHGPEDNHDLKDIKEENEAERISRFLNRQGEEETPVVTHLELGQSSTTVSNSSDDIHKIVSSLEKLAQSSLEQGVLNRHMLIQAQLPKVDVPLFSGDPLSYPLWKNSFDSTVHMKPLDDGAKLNLLHSCVAGKPKEIVQHFVLIGSPDAYEQARETLSRRYGDPTVVSSAFTSKLNSWGRINSRDATGLQDFSDCLAKVVAAKKSIKSLGILDFPQENSKLVEKLPSYLESKWRDEIDRYKEKHGRQEYPPFIAFADFVRRAADKANIPELSASVREQIKPVNPKPSGKHARTFATEGKPFKPSGKPSKDKTCPYCQDNHLIEECSKFKNITLEERRAFFFEKKLCFGCGLHSNHRSKQCKARRSCTVCEGRHLSCFHSWQKQPVKQEEATANCTSVCSLQEVQGKDHSMIVPVWVRSVNNPSKSFLEYAILDEQSNVSFISHKLYNKLNLQGHKTNLKLTTLHDTSMIDTFKVQDLELQDHKRQNIVRLPTAFTRDDIPATRSQIPKTQIAERWPHLIRVAEEMMPYDQTVEVSLLIGTDCPSAIRPREIIAGGEAEPYGQKSLLGWGVVGRICKDPIESSSASCHKIAAELYQNLAFPTKAKELLIEDKVIKALETDFKHDNSKEPMSIEDHRFLHLLEEGIVKRQDGHYEMPLPLKTDNVSLPSNRQVAEKRWRQLTARFKKKPQFLNDYRAFMDEVIKTCAEKAPVHSVEGMVNYVPHTGVYHPRKPGKIRVVFDCSAKCNGISLNDHLLQGPDLTNGLLGVLCRFRQDDVAFMADIKSMFHQFYVTEKHRDLLRFLWWEDGNPNSNVIEYRMKVHLFGATSSPGCANFGLKRAADDGEEEFGSEAANYIRKEFYVDDGLKSVSTSEEAVALLKSAQGICEKAGLRLHKIMSNKKEVLEKFTTDDMSKGLADLNLDIDPLPLERALGVVWCVESDSLQFRIELNDRPLTRRGVLSTVCSIYDPNGFASPVTLHGKQILQSLCRSKIDWDSPIPEDIRPQWEKWRMEISELENLKIPRCYKPQNFGSVKHAELHHFSDASQNGYGQCSYLRLVNEEGEVSCSLVIAKSRVTPLKHQTIPRLELAAAVISAKMSAFLRKELTYHEIREYFWTDSKIVLGYISNESRRFHVYVANRVQQIRNVSDPASRYYVDTSTNPADDASRGLTAKELLVSSTWQAGPGFLHEKGLFHPPEPIRIKVEETDPEVKKSTTLSSRVEIHNTFDTSRLSHLSSWNQAKRVIALCVRLKQRLKMREIKLKKSPSLKRPIPRISLSVADLQEAELEILGLIQKRHLHCEREVLTNLDVSDDNNRQIAKRRNDDIKPTSSLYRLDPFLDSKGLIRVGGRIQRANIPDDVKHPVIVPRDAHLTALLIRHHHEEVNHMGRGSTHNQLRQAGYWVIGGSSAVSAIITKCVTCKRLRGPLEKQKMADLPTDRLEQAPPFSYCAVDYFGPFSITEKRSTVKRYVALFTCMASRAVHLESANSLDTSSFINCLRRFVNRRGPVRQIRSDRGTAFVGARNELLDALKQMDQDKIQQYLVENNTDWIPFVMNPPHASHMGGVWERQIQTVRRALEPLMMSAGKQLDDEAFRTFLSEAESIVNSRPLTTQNLSSSDAPEPLTPNHLLTMKAKVVLPPPGKFQKADMYARKWWRRVQHLTNEFWTRWRKEYLTDLQTRKKWARPTKSLKVGDIVISKEADDNRAQWPLGRVSKVYPSNDGLVRKVQLVMADSSLDSQGKRKKQPTMLERPVHKLVLLLSPEETSEASDTEDQGIPHQGASTTQ
ncbi:uncharacterized protein LOC121410188 [Lytechinus variegatus]|uniref:uncharacterized protein LOC121410188 n=1 Tax=Lytechinus variegatus TaxID=7654 RepID=UPI001BB2CFEF|nr:uncharacterized protein LOC121410188 [Lytechinus variegatus]